MKTQTGILLLAASLCITACSNDDDEATPDVQATSYSSLVDFQQQNQLTPQAFTLNSTAGGTITGSEGTQLTFDPSSFVHQNGSPVTGTVNIKLWEANKKSEMVLGGITTNTSTVPLISGGQFKLEVTQNGETLKYAPGYGAAISIPSTNPDNDMIAYVQSPSSTNGFNYQIANDSSTYLVIANGEYVGFSDSLLSWVNCDHPFVSANYKNLTINLSSFTNSSSNVILVYSTLRSVVDIKWEGNTDTYGFAPVGYPFTIVAYGVKDGKFYSSFTPHTTTTDETLYITMNPTTIENFKTQLNALN